MKMVSTPVGVHVTTPGTGLSAEQLSRMCTDKIMHIGPEVPPVIRDQALEFKDKIFCVTKHYMAQAQKSERTSIIGVLERAGLSDAANLVRKV